MGIQIAMGFGLFADGLIRGIALARLFAIYADAGHWLLGGSIASFHRIRCVPFAEPGRITDSNSLCGRDRADVLPESMADQVALLGSRPARRMGLGSVLSLWRVQ